MAAADAARKTTDSADPAGDVRHLQSCFDSTMAAFGPWETTPVLAAAVSGGADSLALCLLADRWVRARGGSLLALTVDHGLRPGSKAEARQVGDWLGARSIPHRVLAWTEDKPDTGIQEAARQARYALLEDACRTAGALHLLVGHHLDDQVETVRMRGARRADGPGVAGMAAVAELAHCRVLRPLLGVRKAVLRAYLTTERQTWIEDPSNRSAAHERGLLRADPLEPDEEHGLLEKAAAAGSKRAAIEADAAALLAAYGSLHPAGFLRLDPDALGCPPSIRNAVLAMAVTTVGGGAYQPGPERIGELGDEVGRGQFAGATLGGCRIGRDGAELLFSREAGRASPPVPARADGTIRWDNRFDLRITAPESGAAAFDLTVGALGEAGWAAVDGDIREAAKASLPPAVRGSLPALYRGRALVSAPYLPFTKGFPADWRLDIRFRPGRPLTTAGFRPLATLAGDETGIV